MQPLDICPLMHVSALSYVRELIFKGVFMRTIDQVLDKAQRVQKVRSDYKLGLCLGIGQSSLSNYRNGKSLPDEKVCMKLADAMGEDPGCLTVEMYAQRAKDDETRDLWLSIAKRLQSGFANVQMMAYLAIFLVAACALFHWATIYFLSNAVFQSVYYVKWKLRQKPSKLTNL